MQEGEILNACLPVLAVYHSAADKDYIFSKTEILNLILLDVSHAVCYVFCVTLVTNIYSSKRN